MDRVAPDLLAETGERSPIALPFRYLLADLYLIGPILGKPGGFGITYLGWETALERPVAIKEYLPRDLVGRGQDRVSIVPHSEGDRSHFSFGLERFLSEARTLAGLNHPNVVRVYHFFAANGTAYLVMEYHRGASLAEVIERRGKSLPWTSAVEICRAMLAGLQATHEQGVLHCDIKPHNVYLTTSGRVILLDYGAARLAVSERTQTLSRVMTPGYAAYEMYLEHGSLGPWTDVYACAATLIQMLTGKRPPLATERLLRDQFTPPLLESAPWGVELQTALRRALAIDPAERTPTAQAFASELRQVLTLAGEAVPGPSLVGPRLADLQDLTHSSSPGAALPLPGTSSPNADATLSWTPPSWVPSATRTGNAVPAAGMAGTTQPGPRWWPRWLLSALGLSLALWVGLILTSQPKPPEIEALAQGSTIQSAAAPATVLGPPPPTPPPAEALPRGIAWIDAAPWARVVRLEDAAGQLVSTAECATPCQLELPLGRFRVTLERERSSGNGQPQSVERQVLDLEVQASVRAAHLVRFAQVDPQEYFLTTGW